MTARASFIFRSGIDKFVAWRKRRRDLFDRDDLRDVDFYAIARDLSLSPGDLRATARNDDGHAANLGGLLDSLGIDAAKILQAEPAVLRDMERTCALCPAVSRCSRDIRNGISRWIYREYCANSATIDALGAMRFVPLACY